MTPSLDRSAIRPNAPRWKESKPGRQTTPRTISLSLVRTWWIRLIDGGIRQSTRATLTVWKISQGDAEKVKFLETPVTLRGTNACGRLTIELFRPTWGGFRTQRRIRRDEGRCPCARKIAAREHRLSWRLLCTAMSMRLRLLFSDLGRSSVAMDRQSSFHLRLCTLRLIARGFVF